MEVHKGLILCPVYIDILRFPLNHTHQQVIQLLMAKEMNLVSHPKLEFDFCHLKNQPHFKAQPGKRFEYKKSYISFYADRETKHSDLNLYEFIQKYAIIKNELSFTFSVIFQRVIFFLCKWHVCFLSSRILLEK